MAINVTNTLSRANLQSNYRKLEEEDRRLNSAIGESTDNDEVIAAREGHGSLVENLKIKVYHDKPVAYYGSVTAKSGSGAFVQFDHLYFFYKNKRVYKKDFKIESSGTNMSFIVYDGTTINGDATTTTNGVTTVKGVTRLRENHIVIGQIVNGFLPIQTISFIEKGGDYIPPTGNIITKIATAHVVCKQFRSMNPATTPLTKIIDSVIDMAGYKLNLSCSQSAGVRIGNSVIKNINGLSHYYDSNIGIRLGTTLPITGRDSTLEGRGFTESNISGSKTITVINDGSAIVPTGTIQSGYKVPHGFLELNGQWILISEYQKLYQFAKDEGILDDWSFFLFPVGRFRESSANFSVPDYRDLYIRGQRNGRTLGGYEADSIKSHNHSVNYHDTTSRSTANSGSGFSYYTTTRNGGDNPKIGTVSTDSTGGTENTVKDIGLKYYIKY